MKRLLITGGSGLLGLNWACSMRDRYSVVLGLHSRSVRLPGCQSMQLGLDNLDALAGQLKMLAPDIIVHAAGMTNVDYCELHPVEAEYSNAGLAHNVSAASREVGARLIHISTDHLFSGERSLVSEDAPPQPLNVYARTKLEAERQVAAAAPDALIVRTNFFGWGPPYRRSLSDWTIHNLRDGREITLFNDVFFTPILAEELANSAHEALDRGASGVFHIVGDSRLSKYEFGVKLAKRFGLQERLIRRGRMADASLSAPRPRDMSLDNTRLRELLCREIGSPDAFIERLHRQEQDGRVREINNAVMGELNVSSGR